MNFSQLCVYLGRIVSPVRFFLVLGISFLAVLLELGVLQFFSITVASMFDFNNTVTNNSVTIAFLEYLGGFDPLWMLIVLAVLSAASKMAAIWCNNSLILDVGCSVNDGIYRASLNDVPENKNDYAERINSSLEKVQVLTTSVFIPIFNACTSLLLVLAIFTFIICSSSGLFIAAIVVISLVYLGLMFTLRVKLLANSNVINAYQDKRSTLVFDGLLGIFDIVRNKLQERFGNFFKQNELRYRKAAHNSLFLGAIPKNFIEALLICMFAATLLTAGDPEGRASMVESAALLAIGMLRALPHFQQIYNGWARFSSNRAAITSIVSLLRELDLFEAKNTSGVDKITSNRLHRLTKINVSNLSVKLGDRFDLKDFKTNIELTKSIAIGIKGDSGAGKSVLSSFLFGEADVAKDKINYVFESESKQYVEIDKADLDKSDFLNRFVSICDRNNYLYSESLLYNITFYSDMSLIDMERLRSVWSKIDLSFLGECTSGTLDAPFRRVASGLSSGQCQRVYLARALYANKKITVLDEATGMLDLASEKEIMNAFIQESATLVVISHRQHLYELCEKIYTIEYVDGCTQVTES